MILCDSNIIIRFMRGDRQVHKDFDFIPELTFYHP